MTEPGYDLEADVVVLGTGGGGLTAAMAAHDFGAGEVLVLEKFGMIGGTSAMSGGMLWIPLNDQQAERGVEDSFDDVVTYVDGLADEVDPCGENGEFHTFAFDGPMFQRPVRARPGHVVIRDGFACVDLVSSAPC